MGDLNFFYQFNQEKRKKTRRVTLLLCSLLVALGSGISLVFYLDGYVSKEKSDIYKYNKQLSSTNGIKEEQNFHIINEEEKRLKESLAQVQSIKEYVSGLNKVTTENILCIFNALPKNVIIYSFEWTQGLISMECESTDRKGVSSTINNLKEIGFKEVNVPSIVAVDNEKVTTYKFHISGKTQEGKNHEDD